MTFDEHANRVVWGLLVVLVLMTIMHLTSGCAHTKYERWDQATGQKTLEVSTLNWFSGDVFSKLDGERYSSGAERKGLSANGLKAIESKPVSSAATAIGKAATGTSALPTIGGP